MSLLVDSCDCVSTTRVKSIVKAETDLRDDLLEEFEVKLILLLGDIAILAARRLDNAVRIGKTNRYALSSGRLEMERGGSQVVLKGRGLDVGQVHGKVNDILQSSTTRQIITERSLRWKLTFSGADAEER